MARQRLTRPTRLAVVLTLFALVASMATPAMASAQTGRTVSLRVLVLSTGPPDADQGLDLIDDVLDEIGVAYDVLNTSSTVLDASMLHDGDHGFYNGIIVTESQLFDGNANGQFTPAEWQTLHDYERAFGVREAIISGAPAEDPARGFEYGLGQVEGVPGLTAAWVGPAGTELFGYVNIANTLDVTDFAFTAVPGETDDGPAVTPVLVDTAAPERSVVSLLQYPDGREVLLSTISNAPFLLHSRVLAYEFVDFATKGLYLGARRVYLNAHIDDLFVPSALWNPDTNTDYPETEYRTEPADIEAAIAAQRRLLSLHPTLSDFKMEFAFNASGAGYIPAQDLALEADATVSEMVPARTHGRSGVLRAGQASSGERRILARFGTDALGDEPVEEASLQLVGAAELGATNGLMCRVTQQWSEYEVSWTEASAGQAWASGAGPEHDPTSCAGFTVGDGTDVVDVSRIVNEWHAGQPNHGLMIALDGRYSTLARESGVGLAATLGVPGPIQDPLVDSVVAVAGELLFLNHTFTHRDLDTSQGADAEEIYWEINENLKWWQALGLPGLAQARDTLVTGGHSGLADDNLTEADLSDDLPFPDGVNPGLDQAVQDLEVDYLASDSSRTNQDQAAPIGESAAMILPRYPVGVFFNTRTPEALTDEYNWIFHERHIENGEDPCQVAGAICEPKTYEELLAAETETAVRNLLTYRAWPHYFHTNNIYDYDGQGSTLLFDWLEAVLTAYERLFTLPVESPLYPEIGRMTRQRLQRDQAVVNAVLDIEGGVVSLSADSHVTVELTGALGGQPYGNKLIGSHQLSPGSSTRVAAAPAGLRTSSLLAQAQVDGQRPRAAQQSRTRAAVGAQSMVLLRFDEAVAAGPAGRSILQLPDIRVSGTRDQLGVEVCALNEDWSQDGEVFAAGDTVVPETCTGAVLREGTTGLVDVSAAVDSWRTGAPNHGVVVRADGAGLATFASHGSPNPPHLLALNAA